MFNDRLRRAKLEGAVQFTVWSPYERRGPGWERELQVVLPVVLSAGDLVAVTTLARWGAGERAAQ